MNLIKKNKNEIKSMILFVYYDKNANLIYQIQNYKNHKYFNIKEEDKKLFIIDNLNKITIYSSELTGQGKSMVIKKDFEKMEEKENDEVIKNKNIENNESLENEKNEKKENNLIHKMSFTNTKNLENNIFFDINEEYFNFGVCSLIIENLFCFVDNGYVDEFILSFIIFFKELFKFGLVDKFFFGF
jgi:hypothetical protein